MSLWHTQERKNQGLQTQKPNGAEQSLLPL